MVQIFESQIRKKQYRGTVMVQIFESQIRKKQYRGTVMVQIFECQIRKRNTGVLLWCKYLSVRLEREIPGYCYGANI